MFRKCSSTAGNVTSSTANNPQNPSPENKEDTVSQEGQQFSEGKPFTPSDKGPRGNIFDSFTKDLLKDGEENMPKTGQLRQPGLASGGDLQTNDSQQSTKQFPAESLPSLDELITLIQNTHIRLRRQTPTTHPEALPSSDNPPGSDSPPSSSNFLVTEYQSSIGLGTLIHLKTGTINASTTCLTTTATMTSSTYTWSSTCGKEQRLGEQSVVPAGLPYADDSGTEVISEAQGYTVSDQSDQKPPADHPPEIPCTATSIDSAVLGLESSRPAEEVIMVEQPIIPEESTSASDILESISGTTSSAPPISQENVEEPHKRKRRRRRRD